MNEASSTRPSLLLRVRDLTDEGAWSQFVEIYTPLIFGYCRSCGLQEGDAADVAQESMRAVAKAISKFEYDPQRGKVPELAADSGPIRARPKEEIQGMDAEGVKPPDFSV